MSTLLHHPPETLFLQFQPAGSPPALPVEAAALTWAPDRVFVSDIQYTRTRPDDPTTLVELWRTLTLWGVLYNRPPLLIGAEWNAAFAETFERTCSLLAREPRSISCSPDDRMGQWSELWAAVNGYAEACGGDTSAGTASSQKRLDAVIKVESFFDYHQSMFSRQQLARSLRSPAAIRNSVYEACQQDETSAAILTPAYDDALLGMCRGADGYVMVGYSRARLIQLFEKQHRLPAYLVEADFEKFAAGATLGKGPILFIE